MQWATIKLLYSYVCLNLFDDHIVQETSMHACMALHVHDGYTIAIPNLCAGPYKMEISAVITELIIIIT